jgi:hypothetical protein
LGHIFSIFLCAVWGGDPVYPTINYVQDPEEVIDYRGPEFHEPTPEVVPYLMEVSDSTSTKIVLFALCWLGSTRSIFVVLSFNKAITELWPLLLSAFSIMTRKKNVDHVLLTGVEFLFDIFLSPAQHGIMITKEELYARLNEERDDINQDITVSSINYHLISTDRVCK